MSELIRELTTTAEFKRKRAYPGGRTSPFMLPTYKTKTEVPQPTIEGVPPIQPPREDRKTT